MKKPPIQVKELVTGGRFTLWVRHHQRFSRLVGLTVGLLVFLEFMPSYLRIVLWDGLRSNTILMGMLLVFSLVAISLVWSAGQRVDAWCFLLINFRGPRPIWLDRMMLAFTQVGSAIAALGIALVLFIVGYPLLSYELILGTVTLWLVVELIKFLVHRSRPYIRLVQARIVGYRVRGRSFPSGHTSQAFFMVTLIVQHYHASVWFAILLYTIALLVGITRMYVGAHYPRDVLAGAILGTAWGLMGGLSTGVN
jgi:membrane-associated phospholipid phosphatase